MEIAILAIGRMKAGPETELCTRYLERAKTVGRGLGMKGFSVAERAESRAARTADRVAQEEEAIVAALPPGGRTACLDEDGDCLSSAEFANWLRRQADAGIAMTTFVIGGADGLGEAILRRAELRLALGRLTWPHQIVRILLAEQLYRAMTILSGHPYHRA
jgi:23S rRNA (pseudouridine1915-N3)-methyltransferase